MGATNLEAPTKENLINLLETDDDYAEFLCQKMILTLLKNTDYKSKLAYKLCAAAEGNFEEQYQAMGSKFPMERKKKGSRFVYGQVPRSNSVKKADWDELIKFYEEQLAYKEETDVPQPDALLNNLHRMGNMVGFSDIQTEALEYVYAISNADPSYAKFFRDFLHGQSSKFPALVAMVMNKPESYKEVAKSFGVSGTFASYGIIDYEEYDKEEEGVPIIEDGLRCILSDNDIDESELIDVVIGKPTKTPLSIEKNFKHLQDEAERLANIIQNAIEKNKKGINIVLYGPAGSGKSELAKAIAQKLELNLFAIGENEGTNTQFSGDDKKASAKRLSSLLRAQAILKDQKKSLVLMDEFEDLLLKGTDTEKTADPESKILLNRTLEENQVVTIWACNDIGKFHASMRQRFFASAFIGYQPTMVRKDIWEYHMDKNGLKAKDGDILGLARKYEAPPRIIAQVCEGADLLDGNLDVIHNQMEDKAKLLFNNRYALENSYLVPADYDTAHISCKNDVDALADEMLSASQDNLPYALLIAGDKGTGKSTYAYYLAEKMVRSPIVADMKDIVIPTQQAMPEDKLYGVFNLAADSRALLVIDNMQEMFRNIDANDKENLIDTFWSCLKSHRAPVVFTADSVDSVQEVEACFNKLVTFDTLSGEQYSAVYKAFFKSAPEQPANGRAIGDLAKTAALVSRIPAAANDPGQIERRIAASASLSGRKATMGISVK